MKIGLLKKHDRVIDAVWRALGRVSPLGQIAALAKYGARARLELTLGDLAGARS